MSDLDFTLLRSDARLNQFTVDVVNNLIAKGVAFTYATARSHASAHRATHELDLRLPVITYGGTMTVHALDGTPHTIRLVPEEAVTGIIEAAQDCGLQPMVHTYVDGHDRIQWLAGPRAAGVRHFVDARPSDLRFSTLRRWSELEAAHVYYVTIIGALDALTRLREEQ